MCAFWPSPIPALTRYQRVVDTTGACSSKVASDTVIVVLGGIYGQVLGPLGKDHPAVAVEIVQEAGDHLVTPPLRIHRAERRSLNSVHLSLKMSMTHLLDALNI